MKSPKLARIRLLALSTAILLLGAPATAQESLPFPPKP